MATNTESLPTTGSTVSNSGRTITQLLTAPVGSALMYANFIINTVPAQSVVLMWALYTADSVAYISGMINTNNGIDFADTQTGFTGYSF
jgi:hypothetical protein